MSVLSAKEIWKGRMGDGEVSLDGKTVERYKRVFRVVTDNKYDTADDVMAEALVPKRGDRHNTNARAFCRQVAAQQEPFSPKVWIVTAFFSTEFEVFLDPTAEAAKIRWNTDEYTEALHWDRNGEAILNSAGDVFNPPVEVDKSRWAVTVQKNVPAVPTWVLDVRDTNNSKPFTLDGVPISTECAHMKRVTIGEEQERDGSLYRVLTFTIWVSNSKWQRVQISMGFHQKVGNTRVRIVTDGDKKPVPVPVCLKADGTYLKDPTPATAHRMPFDVYDTFDYRLLPLT